MNANEKARIEVAEANYTCGQLSICKVKFSLQIKSHFARDRNAVQSRAFCNGQKLIYS